MKKLSLLLAALVALPAMAQDEVASFAFVRDDASLQLGNELMHLYGIYIPPTGSTCYPFIKPVPCGSRAALALDLKISGDFVHCIKRTLHPDGGFIASCRSGNEDLSAWMLQQGWAVALPDAPFEYAALESIARSRGIGIWGIPVERMKRPR